MGMAGEFRFDPDRVAYFEAAGWRGYYDRRRFSGKEDKGEYLETMTALHAELFGLPEDEARESAEWRVRATATVDRITGKVSTDVEGDWARAEEELRRCYRSIAPRLGGREGGGGPGKGGLGSGPP